MSKGFVPRSASLKEQLGKVFPRNSGNYQNKHTGRYDKPMAAPSGVDGVNHINIFEGAATDLGKCLSHSSHLNFHHKLYGTFSNIESFWYYIRSEEHDDRVRKLTGRQLKSFSDRMTPRRIKNFMAIILDANWQRINQYPELKAAVKENTLPFECYSYLKRNDGIRQRPPHAHWMIPLFTEISKALKEDREPNLTEFLDDQKIGLFDDVFIKNATDDPDLTGAIAPDAAPNVSSNPRLGALLNRPVAADEAPAATAEVEVPVVDDTAEIVGEAATVAEAVETAAETVEMAVEADQPAVAEVAQPVEEVAEITEAAPVALEAGELYHDTTSNADLIKVDDQWVPVEEVDQADQPEVAEAVESPVNPMSFAAMEEAIAYVASVSDVAANQVQASQPHLSPIDELVANLDARQENQV